MTPNSRSYLNRWAQPDSIVPEPGNPLAWDRFSYVYNNPTRYTDPSGHYIFEDDPSIPFFPKPYFIPPPRFSNSGCVESGGRECIEPEDDLLDQITHVVSGESGDAGSAANVLQVLLNRAYNYWICPTCVHGFINPSQLGWDEVTPDMLLQLLAYIATEPESSSTNNAAFDARDIDIPHGGDLWVSVSEGVINLIKRGAGIHPGIAPIEIGPYSHSPDFRDPRVISFISCYSCLNIPLDSSRYETIVAIDTFGPRRQFYYIPR